MPELVADCPRCHCKKMTFDVSAENELPSRYGWQHRHELFSRCRHCLVCTLFVVQSDVNSDYDRAQKIGILKLPVAINEFYKIESFISLKDAESLPAPEHLPENIRVAFEEGTKCLAVGAVNAAATMFRLSLDMATKSLLPPTEANALGLNHKVRFSLGLRLGWLFDNKILPGALQELAESVKEDGNDGAHEGVLTKEDAEDLYDFSLALLERLYTEPKRLELAADRRKARRA